jgi:hypothetical protein
MEGPSLIISRSEKRLKRKGLTASRESGPPRFSKTTPMVSLVSLLNKRNPGTAYNPSDVTSIGKKMDVQVMTMI